MFPLCRLKLYMCCIVSISIKSLKPTEPEGCRFMLRLSVRTCILCMDIIIIIIHNLEMIGKKCFSHLQNLPDNLHVFQCHSNS